MWPIETQGSERARGRKGDAMNSKKWTVPVALTALCLAVGLGDAQEAVDLRVNLATQPVHGRTPSLTPDYRSLSTFFATGNIRAGRAFRGNRNFLEDRYFQGSLNSFYRDTVGIQDIRQGVSYGPGQPYYEPGSLGARGGTVQGYVGGTVDPFGLVAPGRGGTILSFNVPESRDRETAEMLTAQLPSWQAIRSALQRSAAERRAMERETDISRIAGTYTTLISPGEEGERAEEMETLLEFPFGIQNEDVSPEQTTAVPWAPETAQETGLQRGIRPLDYLRARFGEKPFFETEQEESGRRHESPFKAIELQSREHSGEAETTETDDQQWRKIKVPDPSEGQRFSPGAERTVHQTYDRAWKKLREGAYEAAAEAFEETRRLNPNRTWEAARGEALARLLNGQYYIGAFLLKTSVLENPGGTDKDFRLTQVVDRPEDWKAVEEELASVLEESPASHYHAFAMAYLKLFTGRPREAEPYLNTAAASREFRPAVEVLRGEAAP